jgi:uncharacterized protein (TIGR02145 family)
MAMNRQFIILVFFILFLSSVFSQTATINNMAVSQRTDGSGITDIYFTLAGTAPAYYITVDASFNDGTSFSTVPFGALSGDNGPTSAGTGKHIIWNGLQSFPNTYSTQAKVKLNADTVLPAGAPCPGTPTVLYGGQTYNTVQIGTQCWLKENLNIGTRINGTLDQTNNGVIEKYCYDNNESNCTTYGGLYQWGEVVQYLNGASNSTVWNPIPNDNVQGICPQGWHIPTDSEWCILTLYVDPTVNCGNILWSGTNGGIKLKSTSGWNNFGNGNDSFGFFIIPGGTRQSPANFEEIFSVTHFYTSSEYSSSQSWYWAFRDTHQDVFRNYISSKEFGHSVRCILGN